MGRKEAKGIARRLQSRLTNIKGACGSGYPFIQLYETRLLLETYDHLGIVDAQFRAVDKARVIRNKE